MNKWIRFFRLDIRDGVLVLINRNRVLMAQEALDSQSTELVLKYGIRVIVKGTFDEVSALLRGDQ